MKAIVFHKPGDMRYETVPDPILKAPTDVILKVTATAICGSDLHIYNGYFPQVENMVMGHEFMGIVEEVGSDVKNLKKGDRVVIPFVISCGSCWFCNHDFPTGCETTNPSNYGPEGGILSSKGGGLFGFTNLYGGYSGGQAEYVRVPFADVGAQLVPDDLSDEQVLFLSDILPTAYTALQWAQVKEGESVAIFGSGPVGLMTQKLAHLMGASKVIAIDPQDYRLAVATAAGHATHVINPDKTNPVDMIREFTQGRGADVCIDAVGMEAKRTILEKASNVLHGQGGTSKVLETAMSAVRRSGRVSVVGVYGTKYDSFNLAQFFDKNITIKMGQAWVQNFNDELLSFIRSGKIQADDIISHRIPMRDAPKAYDIFNKKEDNCVKVVMTP
ncbi:MAG: glutathione-dependent formaldehyde dehydrogenase [Chitinophagaceae bacterium]|nr:glutathione-dependent formaldehyde dehydrogenase [Oligoflexus sp.]